MSGRNRRVSSRPPVIFVMERMICVFASVMATKFVFVR